MNMRRVRILKMPLIYSLFVISAIGLSSSCYAQTIPPATAENAESGDCKSSGETKKELPEWKGTPLHLAVIGRETAAVKKLLKQKANPNEKDSYGDTPLKKAVAMNIPSVPRSPEVLRREMAKDHKAKIGIIRLLLKSGADVNARGIYGLTPLMGVTIFMYSADHAIELLKVLIENGAAVNLQDEEGFTALMLAARSGDNPKVVNFLLAKGADAKAVNCEKKTALDFARESKNAETIKILENLK